MGHDTPPHILVQKCHDGLLLCDTISEWLVRK